MMLLLIALMAITAAVFIYAAVVAGAREDEMRRRYPIAYRYSQAEEDAHEEHIAAEWGDPDCRLCEWAWMRLNEERN